MQWLHSNYYSEIIGVEQEMEKITNAKEMYDSEVRLVYAMQAADRELVAQILSYSKQGGREHTIETLQEKRQQVGLIMTHAQNNRMEWDNCNKRGRESMELSYST